MKTSKTFKEFHDEIRPQMRQLRKEWTDAREGPMPRITVADFDGFSRERIENFNWFKEFIVSAFDEATEEDRSDYQLLVWGASKLSFMMKNDFFFEKFHEFSKCPFSLENLKQVMGFVAYCPSNTTNYEAFLDNYEFAYQNFHRDIKSDKIDIYHNFNKYRCKLIRGTPSVTEESIIIRDFEKEYKNISDTMKVNGYIDAGRLEDIELHVKHVLIRRLCEAKCKVPQHIIMATQVKHFINDGYCVVFYSVEY